MAREKSSLAENIADELTAMITIDKKYETGGKLPNENVLAEQLKISRTTLREAIRLLVAHGLLEIRRGKGTYVKDIRDSDENLGLDKLTSVPMDIKDLFEMRLIFEPQAAYYAAKRASDKELARILSYGKREEEQIIAKEDRTEAERAFHKSIAKATHNEFMNRLMPILYQAIDRGVHFSNTKEDIVRNTLRDHHMIMEFLANRDAEGAATAMKLHILHAMRGFGFQED